MGGGARLGGVDPQGLVPVVGQRQGLELQLQVPHGGVVQTHRAGGPHRHVVTRPPLPEVFAGDGQLAHQLVGLRIIGMPPDIHPQRTHGFGGDGLPVPEQLPGPRFQDDPTGEIALTERQVGEGSEEQVRHAVARQHVRPASQHQGRGVADGIEQLP